MDQFIEDNETIFLGFYTALVRTRSSAKTVNKKILEAQNQYFQSVDRKPNQDIETLTELLENAMHKFHEASYALEQLWGIHNYLQYSFLELETHPDPDIWDQNDEIVFMLSSLLDQALFFWRSFLDFYMKYILCFITGEFEVHISTNKFMSKLSNFIEKNPQNFKAERIETYFREKVLCNTYDQNVRECWGDLLRSLRDKTAHMKLIKPKIVSKANQKGFKVQYPTINNQYYSGLIQREFENNAFEMLRELFPILYEFEWIPGPFSRGMFG